MAERTHNIVVVGAGIAGLATAFLLREQARATGTPIDLKILEALPRHGGATRTERIDGYTCEWGPNGFLDNEPATLDLVDRVGLRSELVPADSSASNRFIYHTGKLRRVPLKPPEFLTSDIVPFSAKLRMFKEIFIAARTDDVDETIDSFGRRRLGNTFADYLLDPMVSGIFAGDTKRMSLLAAFPKMVEMEKQYGGLFKAMMAKRKEKKNANAGPAGPGAVLHTFREGMGQLTDTLYQALQQHVVTESTVIGISVENRQYHVIGDGHEWHADSVILACPSHAAARIIEQIDPHIASSIDGIWHAPVDVVCHGYGTASFPRPIQGFGVLIPRRERIRSLGTLWSDSIFPGQAPAGKKLLRTIMGGAHDPEIVNLSEEQLNEIAHHDHQTTVGVTTPPEFKSVFRHEKGIAQYNVGHVQRVAMTERLERELPGLFFTGASYRGVSVNGCAKDANRVAAAWGLIAGGNR